MITICNLYQALEIAEAAKATVYRLGNFNYLLTIDSEQLHYPLVISFA